MAQADVSYHGLSSEGHRAGALLSFWFQVQHTSMSLNFPHCQCASLKDKGWQMLIHAKRKDSLCKR